MRRIYTFKCTKCGTQFDEYTEQVDLHDCPQCGLTAERIITAPRLKLEGITGAFPTAYDAWERKRNQKLKQERKQNAG